MSWDEKDWAFTWITGKRYRLNLLFRDFTITDKLETESCHTIYKYGGRNVDEFDEQEMQKVARDYGIMIEHQFLGGPRSCFDYRTNDCILSNIDLRNPSPFRGEPSQNEALTLYSCKRMWPSGPRDMSRFFKGDLKTLETFLQKSKEQHYIDRFIELVEKKRVEVAKELIRLLKQDILMFCNIEGDSSSGSFTSIKGEGSRLNLLFRKLVFKDEIEHSEVEIVFYAPHFCKNELPQLKKIAEMYGIYIESDLYVYDYRNNRCQFENIDLNTLSPLDSINIGSFVSSLSRFDFNPLAL